MDYTIPQKICSKDSSDLKTPDDIQIRLHADFRQCPEGSILVKDYLSQKIDIRKIDQALNDLLNRHLYKILKVLPQNTSLYKKPVAAQKQLADAWSLHEYEKNTAEIHPLMRPYQDNNMLKIRKLLQKSMDLYKQAHKHAETLEEIIWKETDIADLLEIPFEEVQALQKIITKDMDKEFVAFILKKARETSNCITPQKIRLAEKIGNIRGYDTYFTQEYYLSFVLKLKNANLISDHFSKITFHERNKGYLLGYLEAFDKFLESRNATSLPKDILEFLRPLSAIERGTLLNGLLPFKENLQDKIIYQTKNEALFGYTLTKGSSLLENASFLITEASSDKEIMAILKAAEKVSSLTNFSVKTKHEKENLIQKAYQALPILCDNLDTVGIEKVLKFLGSIETSKAQNIVQIGSKILSYQIGAETPEHYLLWMLNALNNLQNLEGSFQTLKKIASLKTLTNANGESCPSFDTVETVQTLKAIDCLKSEEKNMTRKALKEKIRLSESRFMTLPFTF